MKLYISENESHSVLSEVTTVPGDCSLPNSSAHGILQGRILEWVAIPFSRGSFQPRDQTQGLPYCREPLPAEPPGKPKNTGVGSLCLLQGIFPTQELNQGLLQWKWILYQLSYQGSPSSCITHLFQQFSIFHTFFYQKHFP